MKNLFILFLALTTALVSCNKPDVEDEKEPSINFVGSTFDITSLAQTIKFTVRSYKVSWKLHMSDNSWCGTPSLTSGDTTRTIYLDVNANVNTTKRNMYAVIEYTLNGEDKKDSLNIIQAGEQYQLNLTKNYLEINAAGGTLTVGLASNLPWRVTSIPEWLTFSETPPTRALDTIDVYVAVQPNSLYAYREGVVSLAQYGDTIVNHLTVYQFGQGSLMRDSLALVDLYNSTGGANWTKKWDLSKPVATWNGVTVGTTKEGMRVTGLVLSKNNMEGTLPPSFPSLSYMVNLWLNDNQLTGSIPANIGEMQNLSYCYLYNNNLTGIIPESFGKATRMFRLYLQNNSLTGEIPATIGNMTDLDGLGVSNNNLTGSIPESIGLLKKLQVLSVFNNRMTGELPAACLNNKYWESWDPAVYVCPQQNGFGFTNCAVEEF